MDDHQKELFHQGLVTGNTVVDVRPFEDADRNSNRAALARTLSVSLVGLDGTTDGRSETAQSAPVYEAIVNEIKMLFAQQVALTPAIAAKLVPGMDRLAASLHGTSIDRTESGQTLDNRIESAAANLLIYRLLERGLAVAANKTVQVRYMGERLADVRRNGLFDDIHSASLEPEVRALVEEVLLALRNVDDKSVRDTVLAYRDMVAEAAQTIKKSETPVNWSTLRQDPVIKYPVGPQVFRATIDGDRETLQKIKVAFVEGAQE